MPRDGAIIFGDLIGKGAPSYSSADTANSVVTNSAIDGLRARAVLAAP
jgi:hypothetical protein